MKKILALALPLLLAAVPARADVIYQELFGYTNGPVALTSTNVVGGVLVTNWLTHSGSQDAFVKNQRLENASNSSGTGLPNRSGDVHRNFTSNTNALTVLYASFIVNATNLPAATAGYFAHFYTENFLYYGRLYSVKGVLPNTYRLEIGGSAGTPVVYPVDLALNQDYQVVVGWDPVNNYDATLWIDPVSPTDVSVTSNDPVSSPGISTGYAFRQATGMGNWFATISNLVTATTFDDAATNVWASNSVPNTIVYDLVPTTIYVAVPSQLSVVAAGQGLADLVYFWQKDGADITNPNGNSNIFPLASPALSDAGTYSVTVSNSITGQTVASSAVAVSIINGPPVILTQPTNQSVYFGKNITISAGAVGTPPLYYSWLYNNGAPVTPNIDPSTTNTASLVINGVTSANTNSGGFKCVITNAYGSITSSVAVVKLLVPATVTINILHSFVDSTFYLPTNTTIYYTVTNAVVYTLEVTNSAGSVNGGPFTGPANGEFFVQDNSGGICVFDAGGTVQPRQGDIVNITGPLSQFNSLLELSLSASDPSTVLTIVGHTNTLPTPVVLPYSFTNGIGFGGVSNVVHQYEGRLVTLTNSYFAAYTAGAIFASGGYLLTNLNGDTFTFFLNSANTNIIGLPIPQFARSITGPMSYFLGTTVTNRSTGFEIDPSSYSDIVAGPNPPVGAIAVSSADGSVAIRWQALPAVPYSILWATNVSGPYVPLATGLTFTTTAGIFADTVNTNLPASFYQISSP